MHAAGERGSELGIEMADALLGTVEAELAGTYIMPSFGRYEQCAGLVRRIRERHPQVHASATAAAVAGASAHVGMRATE
jgi:hypothetical protein